MNLLEGLSKFLKVLGVKKLKIKDDEAEMSKEEFKKKLDKAKSGKGTVLRTDKEVSDFFDFLMSCENNRMNTKRKNQKH